MPKINMTNELVSVLLDFEFFKIIVGFFKRFVGFLKRFVGFLHLN